MSPLRPPSYDSSPDNHELCQLRCDKLSYAATKCVLAHTNSVTSLTVSKLVLLQGDCLISRKGTFRFTILLDREVLYSKELKRRPFRDSFYNNSFVYRTIPGCNSGRQSTKSIAKIRLTLYDPRTKKINCTFGGELYTALVIVKEDKHVNPGRIWSRISRCIGQTRIPPGYRRKSKS